MQRNYSAKGGLGIAPVTSNINIYVFPLSGCCGGLARISFEQPTIGNVYTNCPTSLHTATNSALAHTL